ncbi:MAG: serine hydrolase domain-containing protein [Gemmatimonadales bacterium]
MMRHTTRFLLAALLGLTAQLVAQDARDLSAQVDVLFADLDAPDSPGAAVVVVRYGEVLHRGGYGSANLEYGLPVTPATVFDIASVSKQFAGMAIAMLVEEGAISLDDDIRTYLPEVPDFGKTITVRHLVHHMSGIRDWPGTLAVAGWRMDDVITFEQILRMVQDQRALNFDPGSAYSYSNTGYNLLAELVARVSGMSFREWTEQRIFAPLGMSDTHFQDDHTELVPNRAVAYGRSDSVFTNLANGLTAFGSSSLLTTIDDMANWLMNFDDPVVGGDSIIRLMRTQGVLNSGQRISYAFGLNIGDYRGLPTVSHGGAWEGFRTFLLHFPVQRFGVVVLSNDSRVAAGRRAHQVADVYLSEELQPQRAVATNWALLPEVDVSPELLEEYTGTYKLGPGWLVTLTRQGDSLMAQATAEQRFPTRAVSETEFYVPAYGASIHFRRDTSGAVSHAEYRGIRAERVELHIPSPEELPAYEGDFYSEELDTSYEVRVQDGALIAGHRRHGDIVLLPLLEDEFRGEAWFLREVKFLRDESGAVTEMLISNGRSRNLLFRRVAR